MESRDRAPERPCLQLSTLRQKAEIVVARARANRARGRVQGTGRVESLFGPFLLGESFPVALFDLPNERRPRFRFRVERELVCQLAFTKFEFNREKLVVDPAPAELGIFCAEDIDPVANIIFRRIIKPDELMIQYPFAMDARLLLAAFAHVSLYSPVAYEIIQKRIL